MIAKKKIATGAAATLLALSAGLGVASGAWASTTPTPAPSATATEGGSAPGGQAKSGPRPMVLGVNAAELASKLGVDQAKVTEALKAFHKANRPAAGTGTGTRPNREERESALAASLAQSLGLDEETVRKALDDLQTQRQTERAAALKTRLDDAVANGTLTQAEADGAAKAVEKGVIGGGR